MPGMKSGLERGGVNGPHQGIGEIFLWDWVSSVWFMRGKSWLRERYDEHEVKEAFINIVEIMNCLS